MKKHIGFLLAGGFALLAIFTVVSAQYSRPLYSGFPNGVSVEETRMGACRYLVGYRYIPNGGVAIAIVHCGDCNHDGK